MTKDDAFGLIQKALEATSEGLSQTVTIDTDLIEDNVVDSLDAMNFLFELETLHGKKLAEIDETFDDFRVSRLVEILQSQ